jgi:phospholipase D1/2
VRQVNATSDALQDALQQAFGQYFHPLRRLRIRDDASTGLPDLIDGTKRGAVSVYNSSVRGVAQAGGVADKASREARQACMAIAPLTVEVIDSTKKEVRSAAEAVGQVAQAATGEVNAWQQAVLEELIDTRNKLNELGASMKAWGEAKVNQGIGSLTALGNAKLDEVMASKGIKPAHINAVIEQLKRLLKLIYVAQLSVSWHGVKAHPALFAPGRKAKAAPAGGLCLDDLQPRQPWQDVHCRIAGQAVHDVAHNFIGRWNATQQSYLADQTLGDVGGLVGGAIGGVAGAIAGGSVGARAGAQQLGARGASHGRELAKIVRERVMIPKIALPPEPDQPKDGTVRVRVLRSASHKLQQQETLAQGQKAAVAPKQCEIQTQMCNLIRHATDFIYIENQFFQSGFGQASIDVSTKEGEQKISGPMAALMRDRKNQITAALTMLGQQQIRQAPPVNAICETLAERIVTAIRRDEPFHVYIVLPEHPEGRLNDIAIVGQIHWTMQSLVFADKSLINRIRRGLWAKSHCVNVFDKGQWETALQAAEKGAPGQRPYESIDMGDIAPYLTLLNLRNCEVLSHKKDNKQALRTEQIYVHSKLLIVDDRHVIMGSANINDRSLDGGRDSEIAVMLLDDSKQDVVLNKDPVTVNTLARKLRMELWRKHLGFGAKTAGVIQSGAKDFAALIEKPAASATVKAVQKLSRENGQAYRSTFAFVPSGDSDDAHSSIWPTSPANTKDKRAADNAAAQMPFDERFWAVLPKMDRNIQFTGFWCDLPMYWTYGENNHPKGMNVKVLTEITPSTRAEPDSVRTV